MEGFIKAIQGLAIGFFGFLMVMILIDNIYELELLPIVSDLTPIVRTLLPIAIGFGIVLYVVMAIFHKPGGEQ